MCISLLEKISPRIGKFIETESRIEVTRGFRVEKTWLFFHRCRVSVEAMKEFCSG